MIAVYFGSLPPYYAAHMESIGANSDVDFLLVTDQSVVDPPPNLHIRRTTWGDFQRKVHVALGEQTRLDRPYKVCDFRPAFGRLFADELAEYDFWGHHDLDVIFGRIRHFITDEVMSAHDKILVRGNFSLYRNTDRINGLFESRPDIVDWRVVFSSVDAEHFDEWPGIFRIATAQGVSVWNPDIIFDLDPYHFRTRANGSANGFHRYSVVEGSVIEESANGFREGLLIHFQKRPMGDFRKRQAPWGTGGAGDTGTGKGVDYTVSSDGLYSAGDDGRKAFPNAEWIRYSSRTRLNRARSFLSRCVQSMAGATLLITARVKGRWGPAGRREPASGQVRARGGSPQP